MKGIKMIVLTIFLNVVLTTHVFAKEDIQHLIDEALPGQKIVVPPGNYEEFLIIDKPLHIIAEGVILTNNALEPAVVIKSDKVTLFGLTVQQRTEQPAIQVEGNENKLYNILIQSEGTGVQLINANFNLLEGLQIERERKMNFAQTNMGRRSGNGIDLFASHENTVKNNTIINQLDGIYIESSVGNTVERNGVFQSRYGFHFMFDENTVLTNNFASLNITGAMLMGSTNLLVTDNIFKRQATHVHSQGLLLYDVHQSMVTRNVFSENLIGTYIERSTNNEIRENRFLGNFVGIQLKRVEDHFISDNDFFTNVIEGRAIDSFDNDVRENYWDTHAGLDFTGNKKSELPFKGDPIFLSLIDRKPPYQILAQSPGLLFLQLLSDMNNETVFQDVAPRIEPIQGLETSKTANNHFLLYFTLMAASIFIILGGLRKK